MNTLKETIKHLASQQAGLKDQRKTVTFEGERVMTSSQAYFMHQTNRKKLREMYMAYGLLRGKAQEEIELNPNEPISMYHVELLIEQFQSEFLKEGSDEV